MSGNVIKLKRIDEIIQAVLVSKSLDEAAARVGLSRRQLSRYLKKPEAQERFKEIRGAHMRGFIAQLGEAAWTALRVLHELATDEKITPYVRQQAARSLAEFFLKAVEHEQIEELEQRITQLEAEGDASWPNSNS